METLETLYLLCDSVNNNWSEKEAVDWSEAEQLVSMCKAIPDQIAHLMPGVIGILEYAQALDDWDSGEVASWPDTIRSDIEDSDKTYHYRIEREKWTVYSLSLTGEEEWKASVETESIAEGLVKLLSPQGSLENSSLNVNDGQASSDTMLATLVYKRFGNDLPLAANAWRRMLGNNCSDVQFESLILLPNFKFKHPVVLRCPSCGSTEVGRDAKVSWSSEKQDWVLSGVLDEGFCDSCGADGIGSFVDSQI